MELKNEKISFLGFGNVASQINNFFPINNPIIFDNKLLPDYKNIFPFDHYKKYYSYYKWVIGIGYYHLQKKVKIIKEIKNHKGLFMNIIHPSSYISTSSIIEGSIVYPMCNLDKNIHLSQGTIVNNSVTISHDSFIGIGTYISPGVIISGNVTIGEGCFIGSGSIISNDIKIGDNVIIGAGTLITKNIPNNSNVIGNPMKFLSKKLKLK